MSSGVILLPTLNRTELVKRFFESYKETKANSAGYLLVDEDDLLKNEAAYLEIKNQHLPENWTFVITGKAVSMGDKVRFIFPELKSFKWVGLLNDDHFCVTPHWDEKVEKLLDGTNMVSTNDGNWNFGFRVVGLTAWSMPLLEACGFPIFPAGINHWFIDDIWKALGESSGCWQETLTVNIEHRHAFINKMEQDETFKISQSAAHAGEAAKVFEKFMKDEFKPTVDRILTLRTDQIAKNKFA